MQYLQISFRIKFFTCLINASNLNPFPGILSKHLCDIGCLKTIDWSYLFFKVFISEVDEWVGQQVFEDENVVDAFAVVVAVQAFGHRKPEKSVAVFIQIWLKKNLHSLKVSFNISHLLIFWIECFYSNGNYIIYKAYCNRL